jgi:hypothetical protein
MTTNRTRALRAETALRNYVEAKGEAFEANGSEISDLIADLLHLAASSDQGEDGVETTLRLARMHFDAEHGNPEEEAEDETPPSAERRLLQEILERLSSDPMQDDELGQRIRSLGITPQWQADATSAAEKAMQTTGGAA